jgi:site-specific recombinase XerD
MTKTFERAIERYLHRWRPTLRPTTVLNKRSVLHSFTSYLREHHPDVHGFDQLQRQPHIEAWLEHLLYLKPSSRNLVIRTIRLFLEDLIRWQWPEAPQPGLLSDEDLAPEENYMPRPLPHELDQAVQKVFIEADTFAAMALLLLRYTGIRIGEMRALPLNALESSEHDTFTLRVPIGKTYSERLIPLDARTVTLLQRIVEQRGCRQKRPLPAQRKHLMMIDQWGRHLTQQSYSRNIKELTNNIDTTEDIYCHRLRHTFATEMARAGVPVPALMKLLGHKTPKMTMRYVEVAQVDVRQAYDQALVQMKTIRSLQARTLPMLPVSSSALPYTPTPNQLSKLMETMICCLDNLRRDAPHYARSQQLQRLVKRIRKVQYDLVTIL